MMRIITRSLKEEIDGIPGYIAHLYREERGPALLMIHQHSGVTGPNLEIAQALRFASGQTLLNND